MTVYDIVFENNTSQRRAKEKIHPPMFRSIEITMSSIADLHLIQQCYQRSCKLRWLVRFKPHTLDSADNFKHVFFFAYQSV